MTKIITVECCAVCPFLIRDDWTGHVHCGLFGDDRVLTNNIERSIEDGCKLEDKKECNCNGDTTTNSG